MVVSYFYISQQRKRDSFLEKGALTESGLKGFDEPHDERGAFRDVLKHLGHFVVSATHQTGLIDTLDVVTDLC
jgi:hypothetical protein